jgi:hypothetical protein
MEMRSRIKPHQGNDLIRLQKGYHSQAKISMLVYIEAMRSDQATFQPICGLPMNCCKTKGWYLARQPEFLRANTLPWFQTGKAKVGGRFADLDSLAFKNRYVYLENRIDTSIIIGRENEDTDIRSKRVQVTICAS